jgi:hypothetical protein
MESNFPIVFCVKNANFRRGVVEIFCDEFSFFLYVIKLGPFGFNFADLIHVVSLTVINLLHIPTHDGIAHTEISVFFVC